MAKHLIRKLEQFTRLSSADKAALERAASLKVRQLAPREDLIREGDKPRQVNLILEGWAYRYKMLEDGRRLEADFFVDSSGFRSELLGRASLPCHVCSTLAELCAETERGAGAILLTEEALDQYVVHFPKIPAVLGDNLPADDVGPARQSLEPRDVDGCSALALHGDRVRADRVNRRRGNRGASLIACESTAS